MPLLRSLFVGAVLSALGMGSAQAVLITETWESTITGLDHIAFSVGDTFTWTVTYDDESERMHEYRDGANLFSEAGQGDDVIGEVYCTGTEAFTSGCTQSYGDGSIYSSRYSLFADARIDLSSFFDVMDSHSLTGRDGFAYNRNWRFERESGEDYVSFFNDSYQFQNGYARTLYTSTDGSALQTNTYINSRLVNSSAVSVPEPSTLAMMGLGLAGLGFARRKQAA